MNYGIARYCPALMRGAALVACPNSCTTQNKVPQCQIWIKRNLEKDNENNPQVPS